MNGQDSFIQVKIDYVQYMMQVYKVMAYDEATTGILFSLLIESPNYLTSKTLETFTGFAGSTISETLSKIKTSMGDFPILVTKKPNDRTKYYYTPVSFEYFMKRNFLIMMEATELSLDFIPSLVARLDALSVSPASSDSIAYIRETMIFFYSAVYYYNEIFGKTPALLEELLSNPDFDPNFTALAKQVEIPPFQAISVPENDSLLNIKRSFILKMKNLSKELLGGNEELIATFLVLILENDPITQDEIMRIGESSRAPVSRALAVMEELKIVQISKKPGDRKKYYKSVSKLQDYGGGKLTRVLGYYSQIQMMMRTKFLPDLEKVEPRGNEEMKEKEKIRKFFEENLYFFEIFISFSKSMHVSLGEELKKYIASIKNKS
jgi:DNA-binding transcriptional regulator GbsR (MarR family)